MADDPEQLAVPWLEEVLHTTEGVKVGGVVVDEPLVEAHSGVPVAEW